jgi:4-carboxymuconolactone decarboxylase
MPTDPELMEFFGNWAFDDVTSYGNIDTKTRVMMILASTIANGAITESKLFVTAALNIGVTPIQIKEIIYQAIPYVGVARVIDFLISTNEILVERGVKLPIKGQSSTTPENRFTKGQELQKMIFGNMIDVMRESAPKNQSHIQDYLAANCFGDYYTRNGLDIQLRELLTFSMLITMGGVESQVKSHIQANINVGNTKETLIGITTQLLPYIGYPRTLNALNSINVVIPDQIG